MVWAIPKTRGIEDSINGGISRDDYKIQQNPPVDDEGRQFFIETGRFFILI